MHSVSAFNSSMVELPRLSLEDWNWAVVMLNQAMVGAVSPNFRMVELAFENNSWVVKVTLTKDDTEDREEVEDICSDMAIFLIDVRDRISKAADAPVIANVLISSDVIILDPLSEARVVFRRREQ